MSALPSSADVHNASSDRDGPNSPLEEWVWERRVGSRLRDARWIGWRLRALVAAALIGCLAVFLLIRALAAVPALPIALHGNDRGVLLLTNAAGTPRAVRGLIDASGRSAVLDALLLQRSARWLVGDDERARQAAQHDALAAALASGSLQLMLDDGQSVTVDAAPHGAGGLGAMFWFAATLALLLYLVTMVVLLVRPEVRNGLYAVMALAQVGNLLFLAAESIPSLGLPAGFMRWDGDLRMSLDLATGAALVHATGIHPRRLPGGRIRAIVVWLVALALVTTVMAKLVADRWWWTQAAMIACSLLAVAQLGWMQRTQPHPLAAVLLRFCALTLGTLVLLTLSIAAVGPQSDNQGQAAAIGAAVWVVFVAAALLMLPFLTRTQQLMREFTLLA
jgi:hypothetical protein